jgi:hypothetical protein
MAVRDHKTEWLRVQIYRRSAPPAGGHQVSSHGSIIPA